MAGTERRGLLTTNTGHLRVMSPRKQHWTRITGVWGPRFRGGTANAGVESPEEGGDWTRLQARKLSFPLSTRKGLKKDSRSVLKPRGGLGAPHPRPWISQASFLPSSKSLSPSSSPRSAATAFSFSSVPPPPILSPLQQVWVSFWLCLTSVSPLSSSFPSPFLPSLFPSPSLCSPPSHWAGRVGANSCLHLPLPSSSAPAACLMCFAWCVSQTPF